MSASAWRARCARTASSAGLGRTARLRPRRAGSGRTGTAYRWRSQFCGPVIVPSKQGKVPARAEWRICARVDAEPAEPQTEQVFGVLAWDLAGATHEQVTMPAPWRGTSTASGLACPAHIILELPSCASAREFLMPNDASARGEPARARRTSQARSGVRRSRRHQRPARGLTPAGGRAGPDAPCSPDCQETATEVIAWWEQRASRRRTRGGQGGDRRRPGTLLVGLEVTGTPAAREAGGVA